MHVLGIEVLFLHRLEIIHRQLGLLLSPLAVVDLGLFLIGRIDLLNIKFTRLRVLRRNSHSSLTVIDSCLRKGVVKHVCLTEVEGVRRVGLLVLGVPGALHSANGLVWKSIRGRLLRRLAQLVITSVHG